MLSVSVNQRAPHFLTEYVIWHGYHKKKWRGAIFFLCVPQGPISRKRGASGRVSATRQRFSCFLRAFGSFLRPLVGIVAQCHCKLELR